MIPRMVAAVALAAVRERVRRPAFGVVLLGAVGLGYLAVPEPTSPWTILDAGGYRGLYNSAYVGAATALAGALWLSLAGFTVVRGAVPRDERSGVGQLLAATPIRTTAYLVGVFISNLLLLTAMASALAGATLGMQLARGESRHVDLVALLLPYALLTLPVLTVVAAAAVLWDTVRPLHGGFGAVVWFFGWLVAAVGGQDPHAPLGGLGVGWVAGSIRDQLVAGGAPLDQEFAVGLMYLDQPLRVFEWSGLAPTVGMFTDRLLLVAAAVGMAALPALWFGRFDPARGRRPAPTPAPLHPVTEQPSPPPPATAAVPAPPAVLVPAWTAGCQGPPRTPVRPGHRFLALVAGELRLLLRAGSRWWWLGTGALALACLVAPAPVAAGPLLLTLAIWPLTRWSGLGTQRHEYGVTALLAAYPGGPRASLAEWVAGVGFTALVAAAPAVRMAVVGDGPGVVAWAGGVLFVPSLAFLLGTAARTPRLFPALYLPLWYLLLNGVAAADYLGVVRLAGRPAGPAPALVAGGALLMVAAAILLEAARHRFRGA